MERAGAIGGLTVRWFRNDCRPDGLCPPCLTVRVFLALLALPRVDAGQELGTLADRLAAVRGFRSAGPRLCDLEVVGMWGTGRAYHRPGQLDRRLEVWRSVGLDAD